MIDRTHLVPVAALLATLSACTGGSSGGPALASSGSPLMAVPPDASFVPFTCAGPVAGDPVGDAITGGAPRDIVGDATYPAFYRAADANNLYFRMRVSGDPRKAGSTTQLQPSSWDVLIDTDGNVSTYEYMLTADGNISGATHVQWLQNTVQQPTNPQDPADLLLSDLTPATDYWSVEPTGDGSNFGGDPDFFITLAIPRSLLVAAGLDLGKPFTVWAGTNAQTYSLNSDFGCYVGIPPDLADAGNVPAPIDPVGHPAAVPDAVTVAAGESTTTAVLANDTGLENVPVTVTVETPPPHGRATVNPDGTITYTPAPGFVGTDSYVYRVTDSLGQTGAAPVTVTVTAAGQPAIMPDAVTVAAGESTTTAVLANDTGLENVPVTVTVETPPPHGTATVNPDGTITYTPAPGFVGIDSYVYRVTDSIGQTGTAPVTVTVAPGPGGPPVDSNGDGILDGVGVRGGGCASGPGGAASLLLLGAVAWLRRRGARR